MTTTNVSLGGKVVLLKATGAINVVKHGLKLTMPGLLQHQANIKINGKLVHTRKPCPYETIHLYVVHWGDSFAFLDDALYYVNVITPSTVHPDTPRIYDIRLDKPVDKSSLFYVAAKYQISQYLP